MRYSKIEGECVTSPSTDSLKTTTTTTMCGINNAARHEQRVAERNAQREGESPRICSL